jgi:type I restriction enzyme S subunit
MRHHKIKEIFEVISGSTPSTSQEQYWDGNVKWVTPKDFSKLKGIEINITDRNITKAGLESCSTHIIPQGSIIISTRAPIGYVAILGDEMCCNQGCKALVPLANNADPYYFYFLLKSKTKELNNLGSGSTFKELSKAKLEEFTVIVPNIKVQNEISKLLILIDKARQLRRSANALTDQFLQSTFLSMFGDPVSNPKGWSVKKIGEICEVRRGASPRPIENYLGGTVPWIKIGDASKGNPIYLFDTKEKVTLEGAAKSVIVPRGALIFANCGVSLGFARIIEFEGCIHDGWLSLFNISEKIDKIFLLSWINNMTNFFRNSAPDGTQPNYNTSLMKNTNIYVPSIKLQQQFSAIVAQTKELRQRQRMHEQELDQLFKGLLQKYFG